jgi:hypothetical protein
MRVYIGASAWFMSWSAMADCMWVRWHVGGGLTLIVLSGLLTPPLIMLSLAIHEAGHAVTASCYGHRIMRIKVGNGPVLGTWRVRGVPVTVHASPHGGRTVHRTTDSTRVGQMRMITLAGPMSHLALLVLAVPILLFGGTVIAPVAAALVIWQVILFVDNINVHKPHADSPGSDGWRLRKLRPAAVSERVWVFEVNRARLAVAEAPDITSRCTKMLALAGLHFQQASFAASAATYQAVRDVLPPTRRDATLIGGLWAEAMLCESLSTSTPVPESTLQTLEAALADARSITAKPAPFGASLLALASDRPADASHTLRALLATGTVADHAEPIVKAALSLAMSSLGSPHAGSWLVDLPPRHPMVRAARARLDDAAAAAVPG